MLKLQTYFTEEGKVTARRDWVICNAATDEILGCATRWGDGLLMECVWRSYAAGSEVAVVLFTVHSNVALRVESPPSEADRMPCEEPLLKINKEARVPSPFLFPARTACPVLPCCSSTPNV